MSVDPALGARSPQGEMLSLERLMIDSEAVYLFDFDGVMSARFEDDIYKMPPKNDEVQLIKSAAEYFSIHCEGMEQRYQRHLVYQAAAWKLRFPIKPGPGLLKAQEAAVKARLFILTARSGWHAVERFRNFLKKRHILPVEIYNVGRVKKDRQIELVCREFLSQRVFFIDDSDSHLTDAAELPSKNLSLVRVQQDFQSCQDELHLRRHFQETIAKAMLE
jgi:hypothetical protein